MSKVANNEEVQMIRAAAYLPTEEEIIAAEERFKGASEPLFDEMMLSSEYEGVLLGIFGDLPDYSDPKIEALWEEIFQSDPETIYDYCFNRGIDLFDVDGEPVPSWRDIAVMLKSIDLGYIELA